MSDSEELEEYILLPEDAKEEERIKEVVTPRLSAPTSFWPKDDSTVPTVPDGTWDWLDAAEGRPRVTDRYDREVLDDIGEAYDAVKQVVSATRLELFEDLVHIFRTTDGMVYGEEINDALVEGEEGFHNEKGYKERQVTDTLERFKDAGLVDRHYQLEPLGKELYPSVQNIKEYYTTQESFAEDVYRGLTEMDFVHLVKDIGSELGSYVNEQRRLDREKELQSVMRDGVEVEFALPENTVADADYTAKAAHILQTVSKPPDSDYNRLHLFMLAADNPDATRKELWEATQMYTSDSHLSSEMSKLKTNGLFTETADDRKLTGIGDVVYNETADLYDRADQWR